MRTTLCIAVSGVFWAMIAPSPAAEQFDPAARAKAIAPFVDEQTFLVAHVDVSRLAVDPFFARLKELLPSDRDEIAAGKTRAEAVRDGLIRAGVRDIYVLFTAPAMLRQPWDTVYTVVPVAPGADEKSIVASLGNPGAYSLRVGGALLVANGKEALGRLRELKPVPRPELAAAFEAAGDTAAQVLLLPPAYARRVIEETLPELPREIGGGPSTVLTRGILWAAAGFDLPPKASIRVVVKSQDAQAAAALDAKRADLLRRLGQQKEVRRLVPSYDRIVDLLTPKVEGDRLRFTLSDENGGIALLCSAWTPVLARATEGTRRTRSVNNLKQLALAMHNYHDVNKCFPPPAVCSAEGKPLLSWRVLILPYVEQNELYLQFHRNEPWDSPHNRALIDKMPEVYCSPDSKLKGKGRTNYVVPVGPATVFFGPKGTEMKDITDGTGYTIMIVECDDAHAPIWTKPDDLPFDPKRPAHGLGRLYGRDGYSAAFCDGSVRFLATTIPDDALRALFTKSGGEPKGE